MKYFKESMTIYDFLTFDHFKRSSKIQKVDFCFADALPICQTSTTTWPRPKDGIVAWAGVHSVLMLTPEMGGFTTGAVNHLLDSQCTHVLGG